MRRFLPTFVLVMLTASSAHALPQGPGIVCDNYSESPFCQNQLPQCTLCHTQAPDRNAFGNDLADALTGDFVSTLPAALTAIEEVDSDGDGFTNLQELLAGTRPGVFEQEFQCPVQGEYDPVFAFKKVSLDFCGVQPTFDEYKTFQELDQTQQMESLHARLDQCLNTEYWRGRDGVLWQLAHPKIRPVGALQPFGDFEIDYNMWAYSQMDGRDSREALTADYYVERTEGPGVDTQYTQVTNTNQQDVPQERRAGLLTTRWFLVYFTMFTAVPRTSAAQAYRAYLGKDIARLEGLMPVTDEPIDYDEKNVETQECAVCHSTLDPLTYPFAYYCGFPQATYCDNRPAAFAGQWPEMVNLPERGVVLGQEVNDLLEWVQVASDSDEYAEARVMDYWKKFFGDVPTEEQRPEFEQLAQDLSTVHNYSIEAMLHDLIETEAYGAK